VACVGRALEAREAAPEETRTHFHQALAALLLGLAGWGIVLVALVFSVLAAASGMNLVLVALVGLSFLACPVPALVGLGLGAAAIRTRGNHLIMATIGLILSALLIGVVIGLFCLGFWQT
jgi:hypothetical protein